jgi:hypothetical protein
MFGIHIAFILDALMFVVSFFLLYQLKIEIQVNKNNDKFLKMMKDTFIYLKQNTHVLHLMFVHAFVGLTAFDALVVLVVDEYYAGVIATSLAIGLLHASRALGLVIGPIFIGDWISSKRITFIFMAQAFAILLWALTMQNFYFSLLSSIVVGLFTTTLWSYTYTLLQKNIDETYYGRIVAYNDMLFLLMAAFVSFMIGYLRTNDFSLELIAVIIAGGFVLGGVYYFWVLKTQDIIDD